MGRSARRREQHYRRVGSALDTVLGRHDAGTAPSVPFDAARDRLIIFSDQHKGGRDGADDFRRTERAYNAALAWYHEKGYTLVELGDVEELWEERPETVIDRYPRTYALNRRFHEAGRYWRIFGNHDDLWAFPDAVARHLAPVIGRGLEVHESVVFSIGSFRILLLHGHQGSIMSDGYSPLSRLLVRLIWRPIQRLTGWSPNTPARSWDLRSVHNQAMHRWAADQKDLLLIAGHTHEPVFVGGSRVEQLERAMRGLRKEGGSPDKLAAVSAELEWARAEHEDRAPEETPDRPATNAYFNTGCCCFSDGDITGIEIADGKVALIRWPDHAGAVRPQVLASATLEAMMATLQTPSP